MTAGSRSCNNSTTATTSNTVVFSRNKKKAVLVIVLLVVSCVILLLVWRNAESPFLVSPQQSQSQSTTAALQHHHVQPVVGQPSEVITATATIRPEFCRDPDDQDEIVRREENNKNNRTALPSNNNTNCKCTDPTIPITPPPASHYLDQWMQHHDRMVRDAKKTSTATSSLDIVMIGDSIVEHWNGTKRLGATQFPAIRQLFESFFAKTTTASGGGTGGASLQGLALGSSMDKSPNLLWHLQHGLLHDDNNGNNNTTLLNDYLRPKVWLILIGTNDLVGTHCSKQVTLEGILQVANYIQQRRPTARILLHGLLPRGEGGRGRDRAMTTTLGRNWHDIRWINQQLFTICQQQRTDHHWFYMDASDLFLTEDQTAINSRRMGDGIHPRLSGMKVWGPRIVRVVQEILQTA